MAEKKRPKRARNQMSQVVQDTLRMFLAEHHVKASNALATWTKKFNRGDFSETVKGQIAYWEHAVGLIGWLNFQVDKRYHWLTDEGVVNAELTRPTECG